jgi:hypothetical protein
MTGLAGRVGGSVILAGARAARELGDEHFVVAPIRAQAARRSGVSEVHVPQGWGDGWR